MRYNAVTDDPREIISHAVREFNRAVSAKRRDRYNQSLRSAAELAWLAACSCADRAALFMRVPLPKGYNARVDVLEKFVKRYRLKNGLQILAVFNSSRHVLHGDVFYEDDGPSDEVISYYIGEVDVMAATCMGVIERGGKK